MNATLDRKSLVAALARVNLIVERRNTFPILSNVAIEFGSDKLTLSATDLDIMSSEEVPADCLCAASVTASAFDFLNAVKSGAGATVTLSVDDGRLVVDGRAKLPALPHDDFPVGAVKAGRYPVSFTMPAATLAMALDRVAFAISTEETRYYLNGVFVHVSPEGLNFVSTDGHRLAKQTVALPDGAAKMADAIVPRKVVAIMRKLLAKDKGEVDVVVTASTISFAVGRVRLQSKLIDGTFPDYNRVVPTANAVRLTVDGPTMRAEVKSVASIASSDRTCAVKLDLKRMEATVSSPESGVASAPLTGELRGEGFEIRFIHKHLDDVLAVVGKNEVTIDLADAAAPTLFTAEAFPGFLSILMPMRV